MYALRRLRVQNLTTQTLLRRGNTSLQSSPSTPAAPLPPPPVLATTTDAVSEDPDTRQTQGRRHRRKHEPIPPKRPDISAESPRKWNRPIAEGILPAYDLALKVIKTDSVRLGQEADAVRKEVEVLEGRVVQLGGWGAEDAKEVEEEVEDARKKLRSLEIQSQVNLPEVRWRVANAMGSSSILFLWCTRSRLLIYVEVDMTKPVHRHLVEQRWRSDGDLDLLVSLLLYYSVENVFICFP